MTLTHRDYLAVLILHISAQWKQNKRTGAQIVCRNVNDLQSVAANKAFPQLGHEM
jgi:hypothetical protein